MIPSSDHSKVCSNIQCGKVMDVPSPGWDRKIELCYGCFVAFNLGKFCELYHGKSSGWKSCITCKKQIHYGCVVSKSLYVQSEEREIKCLDCTQQHEKLMENSDSQRANSPRPISKGIYDNSTGKTKASGPVSCNNRPQIEPTTPSVDDDSTRGHVPSTSSGERMTEAGKFMVGSSNINSTQIISGANTHPSLPRKELTTLSPTPLGRVPPTKVTKDRRTNQENVSEKVDECTTPPSLFYESTKGKSYTEDKERNPRSEHRYVPRLTDEEIKNMSRGSNLDVTPLFEKVLTISDTGKIGRLVLPKKCAEDHFPSINIPEGKPLVFQDVEGKDWEFNFRYWPNNNSRMYVLEGFNYYVTSMKLQAGDTVMFSRLEPERKLVMGHRKSTSASSSNHVGLFRKAKIASQSSQKAKMDNMVTGSTSNEVSKGKITSATLSTFSQEKQNNPIRLQSNVVGAKAPILAKKKHSKMGMTTKTTTNSVLKDNSASTVPSMDNMVTGSTSNEVSTVKTTPTMLSTSIQENKNNPIRIQPDVVGAKASIISKRKHSKMGMVKKSTTEGVLKDNAATVFPSMVSQDPNDPINFQSDMTRSKFVVRPKRDNCEMGKVSASTSKRVSRAMTVLALPSPVIQKKSNDLKSFDLNMTTVRLTRKRKHQEIGVTSKSTGDENKMTNLHLTFKGSQELIRSRPSTNPPSVMVFEGVKLKSYKDDPVIGRPSMFTKHDEDNVQWAQCEKCYKWRKIPITFVMPANWTCRQNQWDILRSRCSALEELNLDMIKYIFSANNQGSSNRIRTRNLETEPVGTETVIVTQMENVDPSKPNKKHPRHRPGCNCIVCMQAPSGSKHKSSCKCCSCKTARRRRALIHRRGKKLQRSKYTCPKSLITKRSTSNKKTEKAPKLPETGISDSNHQLVVNGGSEVDQNEKASSEEVIKKSFDLNLQPEMDVDDIDAVVIDIINPPIAGNI